MATRLTPLKRAIKAAKEAMQPQRYGTDKATFACPLCGHDRFNPGQYIPLLMMHTLVCAVCGHVDFFAKRPKEIRS